MYSSDFIKVTEAYERMTSKTKLVNEDGSSSSSFGDVALGTGLGALGGAAVGSLFGDKGKRGKAAATGALIGAGIGSGAVAALGSQSDASIPSNQTVGIGNEEYGNTGIEPKPSDDVEIDWDDGISNGSSSSVNKIVNGNDVVGKGVEGAGENAVSSYSDGAGEYLKSYYGDNAYEIERNAVTNRFGGVEQPIDRRAYNTTTTVPGFNSSEFDDSRPDPTNRIRTISGRSNALIGGGHNDIGISKGDDFRRGDVLSHELGHTLNSQGIETPSDRTNADSAQCIGIGYLTGNDDEFGSFLGGVRRNVYKTTSGAVDTANPSDFRKVMENPSAYGVREIDRDGFKELKNLMNYRGNDERIIRRRNELMKRIDDPMYMGQFVKNGRSDSFASAAE